MMIRLDDRHIQLTVMQCSSKKMSSIEYRKKSTFLTIQLLTRIDFGHRTSKSDIFDHPTVKTVHNWPSGGFDGWF
jgi:hypothetical protein